MCIRDRDGTMARLPQLLEIAEKFQLKIIAIKDIQEYRRNNKIDVYKRQHIYPNHVTHNAGNIVGVVNIITFKQTFTIRLAFGSLDILIITVTVVLPAIDYLIQNRNSSTIILLEYVCLAQQC